MKTIILTEKEAASAEAYWDILKNLSFDIKLDLISKLSASLLKRHKEPDAHWTSAFAGKWIDDRPAEEIVKDIREARTTNREIEL